MRLPTTFFVVTWSSRAKLQMIDKWRNTGGVKEQKGDVTGGTDSIGDNDDVEVSDDDSRDGRFETSEMNAIRTHTYIVYRPGSITPSERVRSCA